MVWQRGNGLNQNVATKRTNRYRTHQRGRSDDEKLENVANRRIDLYSNI